MTSLSATRLLCGLATPSHNVLAIKDAVLSGTPVAVTEGQRAPLCAQASGGWSLEVSALFGRSKAWPRHHREGREYAEASDGVRFALGQAASARFTTHVTGRRIRSNLTLFTPCALAAGRRLIHGWSN